ncbi:protein TOPAZ1, partial [Bombina bombina]|uniref:protein TOPAZ1 n=1 Tax=Bombina bombina TaxID=8345 RepID=UPI00235AD9FF
FTNYYHLYLPGVHYCSEVLTDLTNTLLNRSMWQEVLCLMEAGSVVKILPSVETLIKLFDHIASAGLSKTIPVLVEMLCKLLEAGTVFTPEHCNRVIKILNQLHATQTDINIVLAMLSRFDTKQSIKNYLCDLDLAIAEIEHCKEKNEWVKLGTLYLNSRKGSENLTDLKKVSSCIAKALMKDLKEDQLETPYCKFTHAVQAESQLNEVDRNILGSIGISVLYNYYRNELWEKGKLVLNRLRKMQIPFTVLKGLIGKEPLASRCQVVNIAAEIYLKCRNLQSALWVLKESEWIINTSIWPCDRMDVLNRHNLLCTIANETLSKSMFLVCFEVLQNLPGLQDSESVVDVCQYGNIFNSLLSSCIENKSLAISSSVSDFMASKKIPIDFSLLRMLITVLGQSCLWLRARIHYKCALSLGCYPPLEGNLYRKILNIPSCMSEVEMLLAIEIFMVTHASSIQSPGGSNQTLQIILKRNEENMLCDEIYQSAARRLIQASRLSAPRLFLKHMTVNKTNDQVYSLEHSSSVKWLSENMKWAGKVWLFR